MKAAPFDYVRPRDLDEACAILAAEEGARVIAGGQTLVPMMAMRLARPTHLIDIARIPELAFVRQDGDAIVIGATTRQCTIERDRLVAGRLPLLAKAIPWIGHAATRARGTLGGSLAHADPAAELSLVAVALEGSIAYREGAQSSAIAAADFFIAPTITAFPSAACLTGVRFPVSPEARARSPFHD